jgi:hypothetical protein
MVELFAAGAFTKSFTQRTNVPPLLLKDHQSFPTGHAVAWEIVTTDYMHSSSWP